MKDYYEEKNKYGVQSNNFHREISLYKNLSRCNKIREIAANWAMNGSDIFAETIDADKYYEVTIVPTTNTKLYLLHISFSIERIATRVS